VCILGRTDLACAVTGSDGKFTLQVPASSQMVISIKQTGYWPYYLGVTTTDQDYNTPDKAPYALVTSTQMKLMGAMVGETMDATRGHIVIGVQDAPTPNWTARQADVTVKLSSAAGGVIAYSAKGLLLDKTLKATTASGPALIFNVKPGDWVLTLTHPTLTCKADGHFAIPAGQPGQFKVKVMAEGNFAVAAYCE